MKAEQGTTVKVNYTGRLPDGTEFDTSLGREPLEFTLGEGQIIPGFEQAVEGMEEGESKTVTLACDEAYGPHREEMVVEVHRSELPEGLNPQVGQMLRIQQPGDQVIPVQVADVNEETVTLDGNHPLAGQDLVFEIELVAVQT